MNRSKTVENYVQSIKQSVHLSPDQMKMAAKIANKVQIVSCFDIHLPEIPYLQARTVIMGVLYLLGSATDNNGRLIYSKAALFS
ncbi:hypothetical protein SDJN02_03602, partial [Cucurbita argyrosperma subsp. argyrosperma]